MKILVLKCGSSSLKYKLLEMETGDVPASGQSDCVGLSDACFRHDLEDRANIPDKIPLPYNQEAIQALPAILSDQNSGIPANTKEIGSIGHRVVRGAGYFSAAFESHSFRGPDG